MKTLNIVIGANYGDEGKGLVTNFITPETGVVVLTNGGAQRGHTAVVDGKRHVFHNFGSATLKGAATYAASSFMVNPTAFTKEILELKELEVVPKFYVSGKCRVTTIYDMLANSIRSELSNLHDSTGYGIKETIDRYNTSVDWFDVNDYVADPARWEEELIRIRDYYLSLNWIINSNSSLIKLFSETQTMDNFVMDLYSFFANTQAILPHASIMEMFEDVTLECGQGLGLDTNYDVGFGTPTNTGTDNLFEFLTDDTAEVKLDKNVIVNRYYVSRTYVTRHGDGQLLVEGELFFEDKTNQPNQYQGSLRFSEFGCMNMDAFHDRLHYDVPRFSQFITNNYLVFTHCNEVERSISLECSAMYCASQYKLNFNFLYSFDETNIVSSYNKM